MKFRPIPALCFLCLAAAVWAQTPAERIELLTAEGKAQFQRGAYPEAERTFLAVIGIDAGNAEAHSNLALVYVQQARLEEAAASIGRALALKPDEPAVLANQGLVLLKQGRLEEAETVLAAAVARDNNLYTGFIRLAEVTRARGNNARAVECARRAAELDSENPAPYVIMADAQAAQGAAKDAIQSYIQAEGRDRGNAGLYVACGTLARANADPTLAKAQFREALSIRPDDHELRMLLAAVHRESGENRFAADEFIRVYDQGPEALKAEAAYGAALSLNADGRNAEAEPYARAAMDRNTGEARYRELLAAVYEKQGKLKEAAAVMPAPAGNAADYLALGIRHENAGNFAEAAASYRQGQACAPDDALFGLKLGVALTCIEEAKPAAERDYTAAREVYRATLARLGGKPEAPAIAYNLARLDQRTGDHAAALASYRKAIGGRPGMVKAYVGLFSAYAGIRPWTRPFDVVIWSVVLAFCVVLYVMHRRNLRRRMAAPVAKERKGHGRS